MLGWMIRVWCLQRREKGRNAKEYGAAAHVDFAFPRYQYCPSGGGLPSSAVFLCVANEPEMKLL